MDTSSEWPSSRDRWTFIFVSLGNHSGQRSSCSCSSGIRCSIHEQRQSSDVLSHHWLSLEDQRPHSTVLVAVHSTIREMVRMVQPHTIRSRAFVLSLARSQCHLHSRIESKDAHQWSRWLSSRVTSDRLRTSFGSPLLDDPSLVGDRQALHSEQSRTKQSISHLCTITRQQWTTRSTALVRTTRHVRWLRSSYRSRSIAPCSDR